MLTRVGVDRVKLGGCVRINLGLGETGPDIRPGLDKRHIIAEAQKGGLDGGLQD